MVNRCFDLLDRNGSGNITFDDIRAFYTAKDHPDVISGKKSEREVLEAFLGNFEGQASHNDGSVTRAEFTDY